MITIIKNDPQVFLFYIFKRKMSDNRLTIPIDKIKADFSDFLNPEYNRRIIFSGSFGIGKTYFLNEFFGEMSKNHGH